MTTDFRSNDVLDSVSGERHFAGDTITGHSGGHHGHHQGHHQGNNGAGAHYGSNTAAEAYKNDTSGLNTSSGFSSSSGGGAPPPGVSGGAGYDAGGRLDAAGDRLAQGAAGSHGHHSGQHHHHQSGNPTDREVLTEGQSGGPLDKSAGDRRDNNDAFGAPGVTDRGVGFGGGDVGGGPGALGGAHNANANTNTVGGINTNTGTTEGGKRGSFSGTGSPPGSPSTKARRGSGFTFKEKAGASGGAYSHPVKTALTGREGKNNSALEEDDHFDEPTAIGNQPYSTGTTTGGTPSSPTQGKVGLVQKAKDFVARRRSSASGQEAMQGGAVRE